MIVQDKSFGSETTVICGFHTGKYKVRDHIHQFSELVYVIRGELDVTVNGATETARSGDVIIIPPLAVHSYFTREENEHWMCSFSNDFLTDIISEKVLFAGGVRHVYTPSSTVRAYIEGRMPDGKERPMALSESAKRAIKTTLHVIFDDYLSKIPLSKERKYTYVLSAIVLYMSEHRSEPLTLSTVGKALGYSPKYISNCFRELNGMNFCYLLNSFRTEQAKKLLKTGSMKIIDIAFECGYASVRSFERAFISITGQTPSAYRLEV